jgi:sarcosine oxidase, subunit gamma
MGEPRAPLAHRTDDLASFQALEVAFLSQIDVRCDEERAAQLGLPLVPNTVAGDLQRGALWLGPDEWLVVGLPGTTEQHLDELAAGLLGARYSLVDVGANRAVLELRGADRLELLASGCALDLDPVGGWVPGVCAQTLFARAQVILQELPEATRVFVRPSFGDYVVDRLLAASLAEA